MANVWFDTIAKMSDQMLAALKADLSGHTLIGEYIGS